MNNVRVAYRYVLFILTRQLTKKKKKTTTYTGAYEMGRYIILGVVKIHLIRPTKVFT